MKRTNAEISLIQRELAKQQHLEDKWMHKAQKESSQGGISGAIREKIPEKLMDQLEGAFEKGFSLLFKKGDPLLDILGVKKARQGFEPFGESLQRMIYRGTLEAVDESAGSRIAMTKGITTLEGSGLGVFGIGLPDIPIFLAMLLKTSAEIAAGYGIDFRDKREKQYTIALLCTVFSRGEERQAFSQACDALGERIDRGEPVEGTICQEDIQRVSQVLATDMLVAKFLQGFTFAGVIGGPLNLRLIQKISKVAKMKYRKRFLTRLLYDSYARNNVDFLSSEDPSSLHSLSELKAAFNEEDPLAAFPSQEDWMASAPREFAAPGPGT